MEDGPRRHVLITGTGRAGTTFLVQLLTALGLDTGFAPGEMELYSEARAGLELDIRDEGAPYIVKNPWFCDYAGEVLRRDDIVVEHVFIPMRDLYAAAESRRFVSGTSSDAGSLRPSEIPGGLWHTDDGSDQEIVLLNQLYKLLLALSDAEVPVTLMRYPRLIKDSRYLYGKLRPLLAGTGFEAFDAEFARTVRPEWMHSFGDEDSAG